MKIKNRKEPKVSSWILSHLGTFGTGRKQFASAEGRFGSVAALVSANRSS
jgi:hypothetical protein